MLSWCREAGLFCAEAGSAGVLEPFFWADSQFEAMAARAGVCFVQLNLQSLLLLSYSTFLGLLGLKRWVGSHAGYRPPSIAPRL